MPTQLETYGIFKTIFDPIDLRVSISIHPNGLNGYMQRCAMAADFGASFLSIALKNREGAKNSLTFILNELVENAVKFSNSIDDEIDLSIAHNVQEIILTVRNIINQEQYGYFKNYIQEYIELANIEQKYMDLLAAMSEQGKLSRIGLLTIRNNFQARIGIQIHGPNERRLYQVSVQIAVKPEEII